MAAPLLLAAATSVWLLPIVDHRSFSCAASSDSTAACSPPPSQRPPSLHRAKRTAASLHRPKRTAAPHACAARSELNDEASSLATASRDGLLWDGPSPAPHLEPRTVVALVLGALQRNDTPVRHSGTAHLRRFCTPSFELAGIPDDAPPQQLSALFSEPNSQYGLFLDSTVAFTYPSDVFDLGDKAFQDVALEATVGTSWGRPGQVLAKLGFELARVDMAAAKSVAGGTGWPRGSACSGCWLIESIIWHDFRDGFRPGIGQEEWTRICG